jgi:hypothetical protein
MIKELIDRIAAHTHKNFMYADCNPTYLMSLLIKAEQKLPAEFWKEVKTEYYKKGEILVWDKYQGRMCIIESGIVYSYYQIAPPVKLIEDFFFPGSFLTSYFKIILHQPFTRQCEALCDVKLHWIKNEVLGHYRTIVPELNDLFDYLTGCWMKHTDDKLVHRFLTAEEQYHFLCKRQPILVKSIPSIYIANYLGVAPETLSRIRSKRKKWDKLPDMTPIEYALNKRAVSKMNGNK